MISDFPSTQLQSLHQGSRHHQFTKSPSKINRLILIVQLYDCCLVTRQMGFIRKAKKSPEIKIQYYLLAQHCITAIQMFCVCWVRPWCSIVTVSVNYKYIILSEQICSMTSIGRILTPSTKRSYLHVLTRCLWHYETLTMWHGHRNPVAFANYHDNSHKSFKCTARIIASYIRPINLYIGRFSILHSIFQRLICFYIYNAHIMKLQLPSLMTIVLAIFPWVLIPWISICSLKYVNVI